MSQSAHLSIRASILSSSSARVLTYLPSLEWQPELSRSSCFRQKTRTPLRAPHRPCRERDQAPDRPSHEQCRHTQSYRSLRLPRLLGLLAKDVGDESDVAQPVDRHRCPPDLDLPVPVGLLNLVLVHCGDPFCVVVCFL